MNSWGVSWAKAWGKAFGSGTTAVVKSWGNYWGRSWGKSWGGGDAPAADKAPWGKSWGKSWGRAWRIIARPQPPTPGGKEIFTYSRSAPVEPVAENNNRAIIEQDDEAILAFVRSFMENLNVPR